MSSYLVMSNIDINLCRDHLVKKNRVRGFSDGRWFKVKHKANIYEYSSVTFGLNPGNEIFMKSDTT